MKGPAKRQCVCDPITQAVREGREQGHHVESIKQQVKCRHFDDGVDEIIKINTVDNRFALVLCFLLSTGYLIHPITD